MWFTCSAEHQACQLLPRSGDLCQQFSRWSQHQPAGKAAQLTSSL
jgi:hypothetical protein